MNIHVYSEIRNNVKTHSQVQDIDSEDSVLHSSQAVASKRATFDVDQLPYGSTEIQRQTGRHGRSQLYILLHRRLDVGVAMGNSGQA